MLMNVDKNNMTATEVAERQQEKIMMMPNMNSSGGNLYDSLDECMSEVEELKNELITIVHSSSATGQRERWDTPDNVAGSNSKGRLRKDRYSALLMANSIGRLSRHLITSTFQSSVGYLPGTITYDKTQQLYSGPSWYTETLDASCFRGITR
jgi:hypothetical protein